MKILVIGAKGFVGKNLCTTLSAIRDGKDKTHPELIIDEIYEFDMSDESTLLETYCGRADFVFNFAEDDSFTSVLLNTLKGQNNTCPVVLASYKETERGEKETDSLAFAYGESSGAKVLLYRFPYMFGKWCKSDEQSIISALCRDAAHDLELAVCDRNQQLELVYIDDLVDEMLNALAGKEWCCGNYYGVPICHDVTLGEIVDLLEGFRMQAKTLVVTEIPNGSFAKKLYSTYISYLPKERVAFPLKMNEDARGSFTELLKTERVGQVSVNISKPGMIKGQHWHHSKWEFFVVVSGHGLIQQRNIGTDEVLNFEVSGERIEAVHMLPGYTHNIINLSETENLVTVMWANEQFDPNHPDTFFEVVE